MQIGYAKNYSKKFLSGIHRLVNLKVIITSIVTLIYLNTISLADSVWTHNGSDVLLQADGATRRITYINPRSGLPAKEGDELFSGVRTGNSYKGTAYLFSEKCGKIAYQVFGTVSQDDRTIQLTGSAPRRNSACQIVSYFEDRLTFQYVNNIDKKVSGSLNSTSSQNTNEDGEDIKKYISREKTILEQVLNYTTLGNLDGNFGTGEGVFGGIAFWYEAEKCQLFLVGRFKKADRLSVFEKFNFNLLNWKDVAIRDAAASGSYTIGDKESYLVIIPTYTRDRLLNAWRLAREKCPGKQTPF